MRENRAFKILDEELKKHKKRKKLKDAIWNGLKYNKEAEKRYVKYMLNEMKIELKKEALKRKRGG